MNIGNFPRKVFSVLCSVKPWETPVIAKVIQSVMFIRIFQTVYFAGRVCLKLLIRIC